MLKKTSVYLEEEVDAALARRAAEEGVTKAEFIRRGLAALVRRPGRPRPEFLGLPDDAPADLSADPDAYLDALGA